MSNCHVERYFVFPRRKFFVVGQGVHAAHLSKQQEQSPIKNRTNENRLHKKQECKIIQNKYFAIVARNVVEIEK